MPWETDLSMQMYTVMRSIKKQMSSSAVHGILARELSMAQIQVLQLVDEGCTSMRVLAQELQITMPTLTVLVDRLVKNGYVERTKDKKDRRVVHLAMTKKGQRIWKQSIMAKKKRLEHLLSNMTKKDKKDLLRILNNMSAIISKDNLQ